MMTTKATFQRAVLYPGESAAEDVMKIQYTDEANTWHELTVSSQNAMHLLAMLEKVRQDTSFELQQDPSTLAPTVPASA